MKSSNNIGSKIKKIRELNDISQKYMADKLNITQSGYSNLESGKIKISEERLKHIGFILEIDPELIQQFNESFVYKSSLNSGSQSTYNFKSLEKINQLYEQLLKEKDDNILNLKNIIEQLKKQKSL
ncbi:MAG: helix-turn-helix domain-containing protein [Bacteroidetes bacterium]|nr:helix-turn-helix domain-containing protein [Bacteroidota bacterium]